MATTTTMAQRLVAQLNDYERRCAAGEEGWGSDPWPEVKRLAHDAVDEGATLAENEYGTALAIIFTDGSAALRRERERRWVAMVPADDDDDD